MAQTGAFAEEPLKSRYSTFTADMKIQDHEDFQIVQVKFRAAPYTTIAEAYKLAFKMCDDDLGTELLSVTEQQDPF